MRARLPALEGAVARIEANRVAEVELADRLAPLQLQANAQAFLDLAVLVCERRDGKSRSTSATGGTLPLTSTRRYLPKRQRAPARSHTL